MAALTRYAWFVLIFTVGVIVGGALVRATGSGAGCGPSWPTCHGQILPALEGATAIEFSHRVSSGIALALVFMLVVLVWRRTGKGEPARTGAVLAVIAIVVESLIGAMIVLYEWVAEDASVARVIAVPLHLVNTLFLLAALALTVFWLSGGRRLDLRSDPRLLRFILAGAVALVLLAASGAVTALADTLFPAEPFAADISGEEHFLTSLRIAHPILAMVAVTIGLWVSGRVRLPRSVAARSIPVLLGLLMITGVANIALGMPMWMRLGHLALADTLWIAYVFVSAHALEARQPAPVNP